MSLHIRSFSYILSVCLKQHWFDNNNVQVLEAIFFQMRTQMPFITPKEKQLGMFTNEGYLSCFRVSQTMSDDSL